jgi:hypothetical protein
MAVRESLAQRVNMRLDLEIGLTWSSKRNYRRLLGTSVQVSAPNAEQAELFIAALHEFCKSLDGKWLAPKPLETSAQSAVDPQDTRK